MANFDFEPPSFSLGLDFESQRSSVPDPLLQPAKRPSPAASFRTIERDDDDDDFESPVRVSDPPRSFKRLRRGPTSRPVPDPRKVEPVVNEEIEDFSSDEDWPRGVIPPNSVCSSSKPSLHGQGVVTTESGTQSKLRKGKQVSSASASVNVDKKGSNVMFPKLTLSPLRRYQLIDSDSDDPSLGEKMPHVILSPEDKQSNCRSNLETRRASDSKYQSEDLWKDFPSDKKSHSIPTPAFDEVIEEYFTNAKNKSKPGIECKDTFNETEWDNKAALHPPAHRYFFHKDPRIQKLVHDRLPYFFPLGAESNQEHTQQNVSVIDYMGQFRHEDAKQTDQRQNIAKSSRGSKKVVKKSQVASTPRASDDWVNPRNYAGPQKNAGSRRVQAASTSSAGQWFMGPDGKRVYVNKKGQELTGQIAYRHYKMFEIVTNGLCSAYVFIYLTLLGVKLLGESGKGFKNSKKKTAAKKKTAGNKKSVPKKK
ncbi:hypothetical protein PHJA_000060200 [Phtheirospermum japonicum]|uniref:Uncharacterized protein n=1 Tax=Phtheirospermum japonicum TaxID=374723 RepID=A0A830AXQ7_9LAMI|nr:hypothetical protein PHJA_000060200 [Phtheirospermum japonicum]